MRVWENIKGQRLTQAGAAALLKIPRRHISEIKRYEDRDDNLLCLAAVLETVLVVKTVMHHFSWGFDL